MKSIYLFLFVLFVSCQQQEQTQTVVKENMIHHFLQSELVMEMKHQQNKVFIYKNDYCKKVDCESYFKGFEAEVQFVAEEDIFMLGLRNTLIINKIDEQSSIIEVKKMKFRNRKK